jgi:TatD DNase family protein
MLIDSHCHLDFEDFATERDLVVQRARDAGLARMITICTRIDKFDLISAIAETYEDVYCSLGTHPMHAHEERVVSSAEMMALANHPKCVGIGESGLDYHYDGAPRELAQKVFRNHIAAARETGLPLIIHSRDADADMAAILIEEMGKGAFKGLLHCFTSSKQLAETALSLGLFISFSGILTFKKSDELREIAKLVPLDRLLVETDAPYLAPQPFRGKRNEPAFVVETAKVLAKVKMVTEAEIKAVTTANVLTLFAKMPPPKKLHEAAA